MSNNNMFEGLNLNSNKPTHDLDETVVAVDDEIVAVVDEDSTGIAEAVVDIKPALEENCKQETAQDEQANGMQPTTTKTDVELHSDDSNKETNPIINTPSLQEELAEPAPQATPKKELSPTEQQALDEAFTTTGILPPSSLSTHTTSAAQTTTTPTTIITSDPLRGMGQIHPDTFILNSDVALRLLRTFYAKTKSKISTTYGGTKSRSLYTFLFPLKKPDPTFVAYHAFVTTLYEPGEEQDLEQDNDGLEEDTSILVGALSSDTMQRARTAVAAFLHVFSMWAHASSAYMELTGASKDAFSQLLAASMDTASALVAHGCLDQVVVLIDRNDDSNNHNDINKQNETTVVHLFAQSVFNCDLTVERTELAAMKFLLTAGCRGSLLRKSYLLQTIRTLYHVYLTTESVSNKTTAKASLQQLVSSVFVNVIASCTEENLEKTSDGFPSENHRDAFLVLRSICKLSMRTLPDPTKLQSHIGIQSSASNETWSGNDRSQQNTLETGEEGTTAPPRMETAQLVYTAAIHPALESKLLALDLLLYVLQNTNFTHAFIARAGPQFHAGIRNYLCVSLLKNCTSNDTRVVNVSLRIFVPLVRNFRTILKNEIEAFVTNVFFVILDSKNSPAEHKSIVVNTFDEICSDPSTLAEIFLNYDCDLSAVDLFHRIVNTLSKVSRAGLQETSSSGSSFVGGASAARMEQFRNESRELRLDAMKALRQVLASLHASIVEPWSRNHGNQLASNDVETHDAAMVETNGEPGQSLVEIYDSKKKRRAEESEVILRFNQKPAAGIAYAAKCQHIDGEDSVDVARFLLRCKDLFDKTQIGEYLGREPDYQKGFSLRVLHDYVRVLDFEGLPFDDAIRFFLSGFRLPGEAQKVRLRMQAAFASL
jgi:hypothetical protein